MNKECSVPYIYWQQAAVLCIGTIAGLAVAYFFQYIPFDFSGEIEEARRLGIVSVTVLMGHPKTKDVVNYIAFLGLPIFGSVSAWLLWADGKRRSRIDMLLQQEKSRQNVKDRTWLLAILAAIIIYLAPVNFNSLINANYNDATGAWSFLGEEGCCLSWANSILSGKTHSKDFYCQYGTMLIYPLAVVMKIFGMTVLVERIFTSALNLIAFLMVVFVLYKTIMRKSVFLFSLLVYECVYPPFMFFQPGATYLRVVLGLLPLFFAYLYIQHGRPYYLGLTGLSAGQSFLFSQEVGVCVFITLFFLSFFRLTARHGTSAVLRDSTIILIFSLLSIAPMACYLYSKGALRDVHVGLLDWHKSSSLGFLGLPSPDLRTLFRKPFDKITFVYFWPLFVYITTAASLVPTVFMRRLNSRQIFIASLLVFGIFLFRSPLARPDANHIFYASLPAFMLVFLKVDDHVDMSIGCPDRFRRSGGIVFSSVLLLWISLLLTHPVMRYHYSIIWSKTLPQNRSGVELKGFTRCSVLLDPGTAADVINLNSFLARYTKPQESVYFFPGEAIYYFLFDRPMPTRFIMPNADTSNKRKELVAQLETAKPRFVVYSRRTWRTDGIPEELHAPEVLDYIRSRYRPHTDFGSVEILERIPSQGS